MSIFDRLYSYIFLMAFISINVTNIILTVFIKWFLKNLCKCRVMHTYMSSITHVNVMLAHAAKHILTQKRNVRFTFMSVYSKRMQLFYSIILLQQRWSFSIVMHQTKINSMVISANNAASTSTQISKSQNQYLMYPPFSLTVAVHPWLTERTHCWVVMSARCIPCGHDRGHKSDVTKRRSWPCIVTRRRYLVGRSVWMPVALNISQRCLIVWDIFFQLSGGLQHAKIKLTSFLRTSWHGFQVIKQEKSILFNVFFVSLRHCQMN